MGQAVAALAMSSGEVTALTNAITGLTNASQSSKGGISGLIDKLSGMSGVLGSVRESLAPLKDAIMHPVNGAALLSDALVGMLTGPLNIANQLAGSIGQFVMLVNEGAMVKFNLTMRDTLAVIGQMLVPAMKSTTEYVQMWGDQLAKMQPIFEPMFQQIANWIDLGTKVTKMFAESLSPMFQLMSDVGVAMSKMFLVIAAQFATFINTVIRTIGALFGITGSNRDEDKTSKGAAIRPAEVTGVEDFAKKQFDTIAAHLFGTGDGKSTEEFLGEIVKKMEEWKKEFEPVVQAGTVINQEFKKLVGFVKDMNEYLLQIRDFFLSTPPGMAAQAAWDAAKWGKRQIFGR